jgi:hypothetical protein
MAIFTQTDTRVFAAASCETIHTLLNLLPLIRQIDPDSFPLASIGKRVGVPDWAAEDYREDNAPLAFKVAPTKIAPPQTDTGSIFAGLPNFLIRDIILIETERKREEEARATHKKNFAPIRMAVDEARKDIEDGEEFWGDCPYTIGEQIIHLIKIQNQTRKEFMARRAPFEAMPPLLLYPLPHFCEDYNYEDYYGWWSGNNDGDSDWDFMTNRYTNYNLP